MCWRESLTTKSLSSTNSCHGVWLGSRTHRRVHDLKLSSRATQGHHSLTAPVCTNGPYMLLTEMRGLPAPITVCDGPGFAGTALHALAYEAGVTLSFIRRGKPVGNAYIEPFNGRFRDECVNEHWFVSTRHARRLIDDWRIEEDSKRPHSSLGYPALEQFARAHQTTAPSVADSSFSPD